MKRAICTAVVVLLALAALACWAAPAGAQPLVPFIANVLPDTGPVGMLVFINGSDFGAVGPFSVVTFNGVGATPLVWQDTIITTRVPDGATTGPVVVTTPFGVSNGVTFTVTAPPTPAQTWYLAEGSTAWGFETFVLMENTTATDASVNVVYNTQQYGRIPRPTAVIVPASSRVTMRLNDDIPNVDVSTELQSDQEIVAERSIYWNNRTEGTDSIGVVQPSMVWYMAEGCTTYPFETWLLVANPNQLSVTPANVDITYQTPTGPIQKATIQVYTGQRVSLDVSKDVGFCDVSARVVSDQPVICERSMYWDGRRGGHDSIGTVQGSRTWFMAEGSTAWGFTTWLLLQNPTATAANVDVTYMTPDGAIVEPTMSLPANSRQTIKVNDYIQDYDVSIQVDSDTEIIAERSMYWNNGSGKAGNDTIGVISPETTIYLAEGSTAWGFESFVCIQNPNAAIAEVQVTYMTNNGPVAGATRFVPPTSRMTINVADELPNTDASIKLTSDQPIMAERSMYWNSRGGGHVSIGWTP
ncbi:MAG: DUF5719 family protein [Actinomycetota bacterium]